MKDVNDIFTGGSEATSNRRVRDNAPYLGKRKGEALARAVERGNLPGDGVRRGTTRTECAFHPRKGSVIIIVLVTMMFAAAALTLFLEKASTDLIAEARVITDNQLRTEAYSALETTVGVLEDFRSVLGNLRSPGEGWNDPLGFAGY